MEFITQTLTSLWGVLAVFAALLAAYLIVRHHQARLLGGLVLTIALVLAATAALSTQKHLHCKKNMHCWGRMHLLDASFACDTYGEAHVDYSPQWLHNWGAKFKMFAWLDEQQGTLKFTSTRFHIHGKPGVYRYECDYDPTSGTVLKGLTVDGKQMAGE